MAEGSQVVVITGASAGVGRATAHAFAREGARICLIARNQERLEEAKREVEAEGGEAFICVADVADADAMEEAAARTEERFGAIDVWVNNAMTSVFAPTWEVTPDEVKRVTEVTYLGYVNGTLAALKRMRPRNEGVIVQVGSALAYRAIPLQAAYCGAKHAIQGFTDSLRTELIHEGSRVRVISVHMPALNTPQFEWVRSRLSKKPQPVPPIHQPNIAADAIVWASKHERRELLVGWPTVMAVYGQRLAPAIVELYLAKTAWHAQQTPEEESPDRPDNLYEAVEGPYGASGRFSDRAMPSTSQLWLAKHGKQVMAAAAGLFAVGAVRLIR